MHLEVLSEDKSGGVVLGCLLQKILDRRKPDAYSFSIRPHRGKGYRPNNLWEKPNRYASGLLDLLPAKMRAYAAIYRPDQLMVLIVMDSDADAPQAVYGQLDQIARQFGRDLPTVIGISVEEMESWLLGDPEAILAAYPDADLKKAANYAQDSICGTWEILAAVLAGRQAEHIIRLGYPAVGQIKNEWARQIAPFMEPGRNRSPSFQRFYRLLLHSLHIQEERKVRLHV